MKVELRHIGEFDVEGFYIETASNKYQLKECADGIHVIECTDDVILIQPQVANSIVIIDKSKIKHGHYENIDKDAK